MPIYDYRCHECDKTFELLVRPSIAPVCPSCGSEQLEKLLSLTAPQGQSKALISKGRAQAAKEGHFSNYSSSERSRIK